MSPWGARVSPLLAEKQERLMPQITVDHSHTISFDQDGFARALHQAEIGRAHV